MSIFKDLMTSLKQAINIERIKKQGYDYYITDELGGIHTDGVGYAPDGTFCGECTRQSCVGCGPWNERGYSFNNDVEDI